MLRPSLAGKPKDVSDAELSARFRSSTSSKMLLIRLCAGYTSVADQGPSFSCELGAGFPPRLRGQQGQAQAENTSDNMYFDDLLGSLCVTSESLKFQPSKSSFADISVILLRDIQKVEACEYC